MDEKMTLEKSVGMRNFYTMWCDKFEQRRDYGACIWQIDAYRRNGDTDVTDTTTCANAINCGMCVAKNMREEEEAKGEAIYFREQNLVNKHENVTYAADKKSDSYKRGWNQVSGKVEKDFEMAERKISKSPVSVKKPAVMISGGSDFADALTKAVADEGKITMSELIAMKQRVVALSKTSMKDAKALLEKVKMIEKNKMVIA